MDATTETESSPASGGDPRRKYIEAALPLFAAKGFHGTSISQIADALGLTKQAMLHHFGSKAKLYGAVLQTVAAHYEGLLQDETIKTLPAGAQFEAALDLLRRELVRHSDSTRLVIRELMENSARAQQAGTWHLRPFLQRLTEMAQATPHWRNAPDRVARAGVYMLIGATSYLAISRPTLTNMFGEDVPDDMDRLFAREFRALIAAPPLPRA